MSPKGWISTIRARRRAAGADLEDFEAFYRDHSSPLLVYFTRRVMEPETALDLTAETFARALEGRDGFRGKTSPEAAGWLYGIARNVIAGYQRDGVVERKAISRLAVEVPSLSAADLERVEELADLRRLREVARSELESLADIEREVVRLRVIEEQSYPEIAEQLRISEVAARARLSRGLRRMAERLDADEWGDVA